jgi:hypothetical protein
VTSSPEFYHLTDRLLSMLRRSQSLRRRVFTRDGADTSRLGAAQMELSSKDSSGE